MAARKKESEGIALLSMYNDDEDMDVDEEEDEELQEEAKESEAKEKDDDMRNPDCTSSASAPENAPSLLYSQPSTADEEQTLESPAPPTPQKSQPSLSSPLVSMPTPPQNPPPSDSVDTQRTRRGTLAIVDYAHDETAMSPEAEEGEILGTGNVMFGEELQASNGNFMERTPPGTVQILTPNAEATPPQPSEQVEQLKPGSDSTMANIISSSEPASAPTEADVAISIEMQKDIDPLEKFLPPPPPTPCSVELQEKINKFLAYKRAGKSFNADLRNMKAYRNPDFLLHAVRYQDIDQIGTCFSKDVFDPHGYDKSDYYDEIEADMKREMERKEQERKKNQKVEFVQGGVQPGIVAQAQKISAQIPVASVAGVSAAATSGLLSASSVSDAVARESRQNKKTKWDKVDGDRKIGGQDNVSNASAHAALLSAANAGAGYTAFAQQKRREAEEKKSSERRFDRRS